MYFWTPPNKVKHLLVAISFSFTIELKIDQLIIANANSTLGQNYLLLPGKNQQFDDKHPDTFTLQKKHLFDHQRTYLTHTKIILQNLKSCVKAQMNRLSAPSWANVECCIVRDTTFIRRKRKRKQNKRKDHKVERGNRLASDCEAIVIQTPALYENSFVYGTTSESLQHRCQRSRRSCRINLWCQDSEATPLSP